MRQKRMMEDGLSEHFCRYDCLYSCTLYSDFIIVNFSLEKLLSFWGQTLPSNYEQNKLFLPFWSECIKRKKDD